MTARRDPLIPKPNLRGVTLVEMLVVVAIVGLIAGLSLPTVWSGIDSLRLSEASQEMVSLFNDGLNRADERQEVVAVTISRRERAAWLESNDPRFHHRLVLPAGISIARVLPERPNEEEGPREFLLYPGGAVPRVGVELVNERGARRLVQVDPITGVPQVAEVSRP